MKINANFKTFAAVRFDASKYIASPSYGVNRFMLDRIGEEKARATTIVKYQPNSSFPKHEHIGGEEFLVLEGTFKDQFGEFPAGTYIRNPVGSIHSPWVDDDGCTIMVKLLQMADIGEGTKPLHVAFNDKKKEEAIATNFGSVLEMYHHSKTGERVQMCWVEPGVVFPADEFGTNGGEELFVCEGSLTLGDEEEFPRWGWLRFPVVVGYSPDDGKEKRASLKAGKSGAQIYRKTGHLTEKAMSMEKIQITVED